jgi:ketosteroid isomerase-like protein
VELVLEEDIMYHAIMRSKVKDVFKSLSHGDYQPVLSSLAPNFEHWFIGNHALSGLRTSMPVTRAWYERLYKIFPDLRFELTNIVIKGSPWGTTVTIEWRDFFTLRNGRQGSNCGVHIVHFKWAKIDSLRIYCDTKLLIESLEIQSTHGVEDAGQLPLIG